MLLRDQPRAYPRSQMLVQKPRHVCGTDVFPALEEATGEDWYGVGVRLHEVGHDFCELDFFFQRVDLALLVRE